jgi:hypothetical protein
MNKLNKKIDPNEWDEFGNLVPDPEGNDPDGHEAL